MCPDSALVRGPSLGTRSLKKSNLVNLIMRHFLCVSERNCHLLCHVQNMHDMPDYMLAELA